MSSTVIGTSVIGSSMVGGFRGPIRLTRRGRIVVRGVWVLVMTLAVLAALLMGGGSARAGRETQPLPVRYHVVLPGETLWGIAQAAAPGADPRDLVAQIIELNGLPGAGVRSGTRLALPATG